MYLTFLTLIIGRKFNVLETNCCFEKNTKSLERFIKKYLLRQTTLTKTKNNLQKYHQPLKSFEPILYNYIFSRTCCTTPNYCVRYSLPLIKWGSHRTAACNTKC